MFRQQNRFSFVFALCAVLAASAASAAEYSVSTAQELVDKLSEINPKNKSGNVIVLQKGNYDVSSYAMPWYRGTTEKPSESHISASKVKLRGATGNPRDVVIYGDGTKRILWVDEAVLESLTISNGYTSANTTAKASGAGIYSDSSHPGTLTNVIITCCSANHTGSNGGAYGGAIRYGTLYNCQVIGNSAYGPSNNGNGGGVLETGAGTTLMVTNCTFASCAADNDGGGICYAKSLTGCTFTDCEAGRYGGGADHSELTADCTFNTSNAKDSGGGAKLYNANDVIRNCTFYQCKANNYGGGVQGTSRKGIVEKCNFIECKADVNGGGGDALGMVTDCTFTSCTARDCAGGICNTAKVSGSTFSGCQAENKWGGGLHNVTSIERCKFEGCFANWNGGGIDNANEIWSCLFVNNSCGGDGGGANYVVNGGVGCVNCTFVGNTCGSGKKTEAVGNMPSVRNCLFYLNAAADVVDKNGNYAVTDSKVFASTTDYHLRLDYEEVEKMVAVKPESASGRLDCDGAPLVGTIAGMSFYYPGCYAYVPWMAKGLEVNVDDDVIRPFTATLSSLRETLQAISERPDAAP